MVGLHLGVKLGEIVVGEEAYHSGMFGAIRGHTIFYPERRLALQYHVALAAGPAGDKLSRVAGDYSEGDRLAAKDAGANLDDWPHLIALAKNLLRGPLRAPWDAVSEALAVRNLQPRALRRIYRETRG